MAAMQPVSIYGLNLSAEEMREFAKREKTTYLEFEIPVALEKKLSKLIEKEVKEYHKKKKK